VLSQPGIAMVGTRHPTPYGSGMAERLATDLAARGLAIISGLARGVDTSSHRGAFAAKAKPSRCWARGIDIMYPKEKYAADGADCVALGGALITEFSGRTPPTPKFSDSQRIISGMSAGVLVVEAASNSGTRITSRLASNRTAMCMPSRGT